MADSVKEILVKVREVVRLVGFYQQDNDHVLRRRFQRLHLYNLYNKHNSLVQLDKEIGYLERVVKPQENGTVHPEAFEEAPKLDALFARIDAALKEFGMIAFCFKISEISILTVVDTASLQYHRALESPDPPGHLVDGLRCVTEKSLPQYFSQYDEEGGWPDCAWQTATEKGLIHRFVDRHRSLRELFKEARPICMNPNRRDSSNYVSRIARANGIWQ
jgi:hypothetical protein